MLVFLSVFQLFVSKITKLKNEGKITGGFKIEAQTQKPHLFYYKYRENGNSRYFCFVDLLCSELLE